MKASLKIAGASISETKCSEVSSDSVKILIFFTLFAIVSCSSEPKETADNRIKSYMVLQKGGDAVANRILLTEIREGRISNAVEALEFSIDCSIVLLGQDKNPRNQELNLKNLQMLKEYRQKHPREIQVSVDDDESTEVANISKKAKEILDTIK